MGFRSQIKKGGGFLNNVDAAFKDYRFEARFKGDKKDGDNLYFVPEFLVDGKDKNDDQHMYLGAADRYEISEDGKSLTMVDESPVTFGYSVPFGLFMDSLFAASDKADANIEDELPDLAEGEPLNLEALIDRRFRLKQEVDEKGTEKFGKRVVGTGKNKKEYSRTNTVIDAILGVAKGGKTTKPAAAGGKKSKDSDEDALKESAADVMRDVLAKGAVNRKNLSLPVTKMLLKHKDKEEATAIKAICLDEEWQDEQDFIEVDKKGNISLTEE